MKLLRFLRQLFQRPTPPPIAPSAPEPLPDNWLTDPQFDASRLTSAQLDQKQAYYFANKARIAAETAEREAELFEWQLDQLLLQGVHQYQHWVTKLCNLYGDEIGTKLANHAIAPSMTRDQLLFTYGMPDKENITVVGNRTLYRYGSEKRGAYFEMINHVITRVAIIIPPPYPPHAFDDEEATVEHEAG